MAKLRPIVRDPAGSDTAEQRALLRMSSPSRGHAARGSNRANRPSALGNAFAGRKSSGGGRARGGVFTGPVVA
jgi:hypothetical protein